MAFKGMSITYQGRNLLNRAQANKTFKIKCVRIGDGHYTGDLKEIQNMINPLYDIKAEVHHEGNNLFIDADISSNDYSGYYLREIGLIALDESNKEIVYAYDNAGNDAEFINPSDSNVAYENRLRFCFTITDDINVSIELNGNVYALQKDFSNLSNKVQNMEELGVNVADTVPINGSILYKGDADKIPPNYSLAEFPFSNEDILLNGNFQIWQGGTAFGKTTNTFNDYTADGWVCLIPAGSHVRLAENFSGLVLTKNTANQAIIRQYIECTDILKTKLINKLTTLSLMLYVSNPIAFEIGIGKKRTNISLEAKGLHTINKTFLLEDEDFDLEKGCIDCVVFNNTDFVGNINFFNAKLEEGDVTTPFRFKNNSDELARCRRYYQDVRVSGLPYGGLSGTTLYYWAYGAYGTRMRDHPTVTVNAFSISNSANATLEFKNAFKNGINGVWRVDLKTSILPAEYIKYPMFCEVILDARIR